MCVCVCKLARGSSVYLWLPSTTKTFSWANWIERIESKLQNVTINTYLTYIAKTAFWSVPRKNIYGEIFKVVTVNGTWMLYIVKEYKEYTYVSENLHHKQRHKFVVAS